MATSERAVIHFYSTSGEYGCFSNFYRVSIFLKGTLANVRALLPSAEVLRDGARGGGADVQDTSAGRR